MTTAPNDAIWEVGSHRAPPDQLANLVIGDERLQWSATLSIRRLFARYALGCAFCLGIAVWMATVAPWSEDMTQYCARAAVRSCRNAYYLTPLVGILCACSGVLFFREAWLARNAPMSNLYGLPTERAVRINGWNPGNGRISRLGRGEARIDYYGDVRVDGSRSGFVFTALDKQDTRRAVYWVNEGRFRTDLPTGRGT